MEAALTIPFWLELVATLIGALSGSIHAVKHKYDFFGVVCLARSNFGNYNGCWRRMCAGFGAFAPAAYFHQWHAIRVGYVSWCAFVLGAAACSRFGRLRGNAGRGIYSDHAFHKRFLQN